MWFSSRKLKIIYMTKKNELCQQGGESNIDVVCLGLVTHQAQWGITTVNSYCVISMAVTTGAGWATWLQVMQGCVASGSSRVPRWGPASLRRCAWWKSPALPPASPETATDAWRAAPSGGSSWSKHNKNNNNWRSLIHLCQFSGAQQSTLENISFWFRPLGLT